MTNTNASETSTTLVTGGTGKTGRRVAERLEARGLPVRIGSRSGTPPFSWDDESTWEQLLEGVGSVYISYQPDLAFPGAAESVGRLSKLAADKGAERLVILSGRGEEGALAGERAAQEAGLDWTVVRCSWFNQNFNESFFLEPVLGGELALPTGDAVEPFVDADDIADVAVAALTDSRHAGKVYELTGPRLLSFDDAVAEINRATGRDIRYVRVSDEEFRGILKENDLPSEIADLFGMVLDGRNAHLMDGVQQALGREPKDFSSFAREAAATGVWNP
ncbi:NmrA family NAD(P)-binding protein [Nocardiopsis salina]|uniref:NmrA family NAD(P)-binding protein n=1 Tax=Nocardiopsis salina TaxID=245836 RepID=UPI00034ACFEF|nr:NmrA family NAD(P)-binding protein [Nocardiopsis salina]